MADAVRPSSGEAEVIITGGSEAAITPMGE